MNEYTINQPIGSTHSDEPIFSTGANPPAYQGSKWQNVPQQSHKVLALFGYPMDNSVRAKLFPEFSIMRVYTEKWKDICYLIYGIKVENGTPMENVEIIDVVL